MECNCKSLEIVLAVVVFIAAVWPGLIGDMASRWVVAVAAVILVVHALLCRMCVCCICTMCRKKMNFKEHKKARK